MRRRQVSQGTRSSPQPGPVCARSAIPGSRARAARRRRSSPYPARRHLARRAVAVLARAPTWTRRIERAVGFHVTCADCHVKRRQARAPRSRDLRALSRAPRQARRRRARWATAPAATPATRSAHARRLIRGDLRFDHDRHRTDRRGTADPLRAMPRIDALRDRCLQITPRRRSRAASAATTTPTARPTTSGCACAVPATPAARRRSRRSRRVITCRRPSTRSITRSRFAAITPMPPTRQRALRACHTQMSGNAADACDECHQTMRPADHRITLRELDHGTEAAADRKRCARCHVDRLLHRLPRAAAALARLPGHVRRLDHGRLARDQRPRRA